MNPGVQALEQLVEMGLFSKGVLPGSPTLQYWPCGRPTPRQWPNAAGLVHQVAKWCGERGLSVVRGRSATDLVYHYDARHDPLPKEC